MQYVLYNMCYNNTKGGEKMPPKTKITREMILEAACEIVRERGIESINARAVAQRLNCSTQPVMYNFATIEELKRAVYARADEEHSRRLMDIRGRYESPVMEIGMNYIHFAMEEPNLFKLLFQVDAFSNQSFDDLWNAEELKPVLQQFSTGLGVNMEQAKKIFAARFFLVHGIASMVANNSMEPDEETILQILRLKSGQ